MTSAPFRNPVSIREQRTGPSVRQSVSRAGNRLELSGLQRSGSKVAQRLL